VGLWRAVGDGRGVAGLGPEDYVTDDDEAECRAFDLQMRLLEEVAEAERQREERKKRSAISIIREYEGWHAESATHRVKQEVIDLDNG
jgi:hypothetical protein